MTSKDLLLETIATATGKSLEACEALLRGTEPGLKILTLPPKELTEAEVNELREKFANEMPGIIAWLSKEIMIQQPPQGFA